MMQKAARVRALSLFLREACGARRCRVLVVVVLCIGILPAAAAGRDIRAVASFYYTGNASESSSGLGNASQEQTSGTYVAGQWGDEEVEVTWSMHVSVPVIIDNFGSGHDGFVSVRGNARVISFELSGTVTKHPLAGCEFGNACPSATAPHEQDCDSDLSAAEAWARDVGAGGHPEATIQAGELIVELHTPAEFDAMTSTQGQTPCRGNPTSTQNIGLDAFTPPVAFNGNPQPPVNARKLREYDNALRPTLRLGLVGPTFRSLSDDRFNINWHWTGRWAPPGEQQLGPDYSQLLDLKSQIEKVEVRGI